MQNLSTSQKPTIDSREVAKMIGKRHDHLIRDIKGYLEIISTTPKLGASDFFITSIYKDSKGEARPCYQITKMGCEMVANKLTGRKGVIFTAAYVKKFNDMENQPPQIVKDYLALSFEDKAIAYFTAKKKNRLLEKQVADQQPKVMFAESVQASDNSILVRELARMIKQKGYDTGEKRLFAWLREGGFLIRQHGDSYNLPTQKSADMKLIEISKRTLTNPDGTVRVTRTPRITGKGQVYFLNKFIFEHEGVAQ